MLHIDNPLPSVILSFSNTFSGNTCWKYSKWLVGYDTCWKWTFLVFSEMAARDNSSATTSSPPPLHSLWIFTYVEEKEERTGAFTAVLKSRQLNPLRKVITYPRPLLLPYFSSAAAAKTQMWPRWQWWRQSQGYHALWVYIYLMTHKKSWWT